MLKVNTTTLTNLSFRPSAQYPVAVVVPGVPVVLFMNTTPEAESDLVYLMSLSPYRVNQ